MTRPKTFAAGVGVLLAVWVWPLPWLSTPPFATHMAMHMALVAVAAPLLALGVAGGRLDPVPRARWLFAAIPASIAEGIAVWAWHAPALHHAARHETWAFLLEQATFLATGLWLWGAALGGSAALRRERAAAGITGLLLTAMHMTLLGALIALSRRELFGHGHGGSLGPLVDQQLGGAIMILVGGAAYLAGGLGLAADWLLSRRSAEGPT